jgi:hypothetical protein
MNGNLRLGRDRVLVINEQIRKQMAQALEDAKESHGLKTSPLLVRLQLIGNVLKLKVDVHELSFKVQVSKNIDGMLATKDCNVLLLSGRSTIDTLIDDLIIKYDEA